MKVLVTGGAGFIGGALTKRLVEKGDSVTCLVRDRRGIAKLSKLGVKIAAGDISDPEIEKYFKGMDMVFNCAATLAYHNQPDREFWKTNVVGVRNLLEISLRNKVRLFTHLSSVAVFNPKDIYSRTKLEGEKLVGRYKKKGLKTIVVRPTIAYGPGDTRPGFLEFFKLSKIGIVPVVGGGNNFFHTIYIGNLIDAIVFLAGSSKAAGGGFVIGDKPCPKMKGVIGAIMKAVGCKLSVNVPLFIAYPAAYFFGLVKVFGVKVPLSLGRVKFLTEERKYDLSQIERLGFAPKVDLESGMRETYSWYRKKGYIA